MRQFLLEKAIIDDFVSKMIKHLPAWQNPGRANDRRNHLSKAISDICDKYQTNCQGIVAPKVGINTGNAFHLNESRWELDVDSAIDHHGRLTDNEFAEILASAFQGLCDAEIKWYDILMFVKTVVIDHHHPLSVVKSVRFEPPSIIEKAHGHIQRVRSSSITPTQLIWNPRTISELVCDSCRQRGLRVTIHPGGLVSPGLAPAGFILPVVNPVPAAPLIPSSSDLSKPCFKKNEFDENTLKAWDSLRKKTLTIDKNLKKEKWQHIVHMDWRSLDPLERDLLVRGKFPGDWKKVSASLVSNEMPHWTYIYNVYPKHGVNRGGLLRVGYILDVPSQNILSTNPEDIASIESVEYMAECRKHGGGPCDVTCYIKANIRGRRKKPDHRWQRALKDLLTPDELMNQTRIVRNWRAHQNELIIVNPGGTLKKNTYEGMPAIGQIKVKAIYLIIDDDDSSAKRASDLAWANRIALKNNLPIFKTYRSSNLTKFGSYICEGQPKQRVFFNGLANEDNKIIVKKLSAWESVRKVPVKQENLKNWQHIVHMDKRVLSDQEPLAIGGKFPGDWKKISASLVSEKTPDWTYKVNGFNGTTTPIRVGYILDVPPQNILSTDPWNVASIGSESHISNCRKPHKSGKCHILCYLQAKVKKNKHDLYGLHALQYLLTPEELIMQQWKNNQNGHNELLIIGEGTSNRPLYEGMKRTTEVLVRGIYLVISKADSMPEQRRNLAWAEKASKKNNDLPIFKVHV